ncbi:MAG: DnaJ domain-containing protein [Aureispira sp.]|nr:DnaJ domain-containing protein [Aureispira sp.]
MKDYYYILGVERSASKDEILIAYKKLYRKFHPDNNDGDKFFEAHFRSIQEAYEVLSDAQKRAKYNFKLYGETANTDVLDAVAPKVREFTASKKYISSGDLLTLTWRVAHADRVFIEHLGKVSSKGTKTIRLTEIEEATIPIMLRASNSLAGESTSKTIYVYNKNHKGKEEEVAVKENRVQEVSLAPPKKTKKRARKKVKKTPKPNSNRPSRAEGNALYAYSIVFVLILLIIFLAYIIYKLNKFS